jgi:phage gp45-like
MNRNSLTEMSGRIMHLASRFTLNKSTDLPMMQELFLDSMNSDGRNKVPVERVQAFGFTSTPLPRDEDDKKQGGESGGGSGGDGEKNKGPSAEGICLYLGGQRNHPVCIAIDDRRHRPMGLKPGENAQYDDIGQMTLLRRTGMFILSLDSDEKGSDGKTKKVERMVSLRHVEKKKQERHKTQPKASLLRGESAEQWAAAQAKAKEEHKHEGETVNTEVRCTKGRIEFRSGDKVVGYYDVGKEEWHLSGKIVTMQGSSRVETIGKTYLGLDSKNENGVLVETVTDVPSKQTFAKVT